MPSNWLPSHPRMEVPRSQAERIADALAVAGVLAGLLVAGVAWAALPERIPVHFDFHGQPDGWGTRGALFLLPLCALVPVVLLSVAAPYPHRFNYVVPITEENAPFQYRNARLVLAVLKAEIAWFFAAITMLMVLAAQRGTLHGAPWVPLSFIAVIFGTVVFFVVRSVRRR